MFAIDSGCKNWHRVVSDHVEQYTKRAAKTYFIFFKVTRYQTWKSDRNEVYNNTNTNTNTIDYNKLRIVIRSRYQISRHFAIW